MSILTLFVVIPALMLLGLWLAKSLNQVRGVMVAGAGAWCDGGWRFVSAGPVRMADYLLCSAACSRKY